jgi:hypothetical protein
VIGVVLEGIKAARGLALTPGASCGLVEGESNDCSFSPQTTLPTRLRISAFTTTGSALGIRK